MSIPFGAVPSAHRLRTPWVLLVLCAVHVLGSAGSARAGAVDEADLRSWISTALEVYNERSDDPLPFLTTQQIDRLLDHEVVRIRRRDAPMQESSADDRPERVTGFFLIHQPRIRVWLAALDPEFQATDMLTELRLEQDSDGGSLWYQHLDLPWPITDRHWVIRLWKNLPLSQSTEGFVWEQVWDLAENGPAIARRILREGRVPGLDEKTMDQAIYLPLNQGSWTLFALTEDITFLAYRVSTIVGGSIPDSWITTFAMAQLEGLLRGVEKHATEAYLHYDPQRTPIYGGDGVLIERQGASPDGP